MVLHGLESSHLFFLLVLVRVLLMWLKLVVGGMRGLCSLVVIVLVDRYAQIALH